MKSLTIFLTFSLAYHIVCLENRVWPFESGDVLDQNKPGMLDPLAVFGTTLKSMDLMDGLFKSARNTKGLYKDSAKSLSVNYKNGVDKDLGSMKNVMQIEDGFIFFYPMPASEQDSCEISDVIWNDPFVRVQIYNTFGLSSDSIKLYQQDTNDLWEIVPMEKKIEIDREYKDMYDFIEMNNDAIKKNIKILADKTQPVPAEMVSIVDRISKFFRFLDRQNNALSSPFATILFNQVTGYFRPNINIRTGTCRNFLSFMKELAETDPTFKLPPSADSIDSKFNLESKTEYEVWAEDHCVVIHHDVGTGKSLICHSQNKAVSKGIVDFLNSNVDALTDNCEFLARHLRYEREKINRFIENVNKSGMVRRRRR